MGKDYLHLGARKLRRQSRQLRGSECYMDKKLHRTESYEDPHRLTSVCCRSQKVTIFGRAHSNRPCRKRLSDTCQTTRLENVVLKSLCSSCCILSKVFLILFAKHIIVGLLFKTTRTHPRQCTFHSHSDFFDQSNYMDC